MSKKVLIFQGGWDGHKPENMAARFHELFKQTGWSVNLTDTLEVLDDREALLSYDLIVPTWTMGALTKSQENHLSLCPQRS